MSTMLRLGRMNRIASLAILPLMALAMLFAMRLQPADSETAELEPPRAGQLVVANLRGESLTLHDFDGAGSSGTLALFGPPHEIAERAGRLWITLGRANRVLEVDPRAPGILATHDFPGEPHGIAFADDRLVVTLDRAHEAALIDLPAFTETRVATGDTPHVVAVVGGEIYITDSRDNALRLLGQPARSVPTGALPESVAVVGDLVVTADADGGALSVVRRRSLEPVASISLGGRPTRVVPLDATRVAVSLNNAATVAIVNVANGQVERKVEVAGRPDGICLDPSGSYAAVVSNEHDVAQVFALPGWRLVQTIRTGHGPGACAWLPAPSAAG